MTNIHLNDRDADKVFAMAEGHLQEAARYLKQLHVALDKERVCRYTLFTALDETDTALQRVRQARQSFDEKRRSEIEILESLLTRE